MGSFFGVFSVILCAASFVLMLAASVVELWAPEERV